MAPSMSRQDSRARAEEAYRLRAVGRTYAEIAVELGFGSAGAVHTTIARLHRRAPATSPEAARRSASEGLRVVRSMLFEQAVDAKNSGDSEKLIDCAKEIRLNISEDAKLHGAHAPVRSQLDVNVRQDPSTIIAEARERLLSVVDAEVIEIPARKEIAG